MPRQSPQDIQDPGLYLLRSVAYGIESTRGHLTCDRYLWTSIQGRAAPLEFEEDTAARDSHSPLDPSAFAFGGAQQSRALYETG